MAGDASALSSSPGAATGVDVSVLVPVRNEAPGIRDTVSAMLAQRFGGSVEFLFMDGGSRDGTSAILDELAAEDPRVRVIDNPHGGIPQALNIGLRHARGRFVARMDAHTVYPPDYLETGVDWLESGRADWVAGPQLAHGVNTWSRRIAYALGSRLGIGAASFRRAELAAFEADSGFTGVWRAETLERLGGWDEAWVVNEDGELAARVREAGGRIMCVPHMAARWIPRRSLRGLVAQYWRYGQYREKTCLHHPSSMRRSQLLPPALVLATAASVVPTPAARPARLVVAAYVLALTAETLRLAGRGVPARDAGALPVVFVSIHLAWGGGFLLGCLRFGVPMAALRGAAGLGRFATPAPPREPAAVDPGV